MAIVRCVRISYVVNKLILFFIKMSVSAEYMLKQSRVSMSIDSSITLKSLVETSIAPGVQLQLAAEMAQLQGQYRFGYGLLMG